MNNNNENNQQNNINPNNPQMGEQNPNPQAPNITPENVVNQGQVSLEGNNASIPVTPSVTPVAAAPVENTSTVNQTAPVIETIPNPVNNTQPMNNGIQPNIETLNEEPAISTPTQNTPNTIPDNFNAVPVPPVFDEPASNKKKGKKNIIIILLVVILIMSIGFGIYYFLNSAKTISTAGSIVTKDYILELGETLSDNIEDYVTVSGYDISTCTLNTDEIKNEVGAYNFTVTCGNIEKNGMVIIDDTTKPEAIVTDVTVIPNATIKPEEFIESCLDASSCTYQFEEEEKVKEALQKVGEYEIDITVSDKYGNESTVTANLIVSNDAPVRYLICTQEPKNVDEIYAELTESYKIGVNSQNNFFNATKSYAFKFDDIEDYNAIRNNYRESVGIQNITGKASFNEQAKTITIAANQTLEDINKELTVSLAGDMSTLQMFLTINGYTCQ